MCKFVLLFFACTYLFNEVKKVSVLNEEKRFDSCLYGVCPSLSKTLSKIDPFLKQDVQEIRLRAGKPLALTVKNKILYVSENGECKSTAENAQKVTLNDVQESFKLLIRGSVYSHLSEIKEGYIMMRYGHRAGICGSFTKTGNISNVSSVNIRISREIKGAANQLLKAYNGGGVLIAGPPASGKTTVLRDFIRGIASAETENPKRVCLVDTRGEISASFLGECFNDLGENCDVLVGFEKSKGFLMAIRTMFPNIVAFDEIGTNEELEGVMQGFMSGVDVVVTAHVGNEADLMRREITKKLLQSGAITTVALLSGYPFCNTVIKTADEVLKQCGQ